MDDTHKDPDLIQAPALPTKFTLSSGQTVLIRAIRPSDASLLVDMFHHLSERTRRLRFHTYTGKLVKERIWREAIALSDLDPTRQAALVAVHEDEIDQYIVGVARLARATAEDTDAEAAIVVRDDFQKLGLGTHLMSLLVPTARAMGIQRLCGWIMTGNKHMLHMIHKANLPIERDTRSGETFVAVSLTS
jgi:acetyltransferase